MEKSYRIHTNISQDTLLNVNMKQSFDFLEVLSLKLRQKDAYRLHSSNYGVIIGRVLANDAFGIPNAKISVFIERDENDSVEIENIYPYSEVTSQDSDGRRYNLLPDYSDDDCYRVVGTFPNKRYLLDDDVQVEVYDKYWKYTTVSNNAGDYMIFGVPAGSQQVHVDIDLSDIGILSQKPRDFIYRGYDISEFDSPSQFKESTNFDSLRQIFTQDKSVYVYPFWGDDDNGVAAITRCDIQITYKFEPTCVFMGSIVSDNEANSIGHKCAPNIDNGMNSQLVAGEGTIEMIRKTPDGLVEEYPIQGNALIDNDGVWCYQIPMNLDYVGTDEYGNIVATDNPTKGIPTRTQVRFRISKSETGDEGFSRHTAKYLVPMNPIFSEDSEVPLTQEPTGEDMEKMYNFGSNTPQSCFRDLYWNNVYSVKNFIPKTQVAHRAYAPNYSALKGSNLVENQNPIPFNKLRIDVPFRYMIICVLFSIILLIITFINTIVCVIDTILDFLNGFRRLVGRLPLVGKAIRKITPKLPLIPCIAVPAGVNEGNDAYYPGCCKAGLKASKCPDEMENDCTKHDGYNLSPLKDRIQRNLALEYKIVKLDFYQDWINGVLYMPLWYWRKRKKRTYLFGLIKSRAKSDFCDCDRNYSRLKTFVTCNIVYTGNSLDVNDNAVTENEEKWHKRRSARVRYNNGLIKGVENRDGLTAYYYTAYQANTSVEQVLPIKNRFKPFSIVRLYATDIILLGNLNEDNYYGIPQLFTKLPSTTANIPLIATVEESLSDPDDGTKVSENDTAGDASDSGTVITTGMDWGYNGKKQTPKYKNGLFIDLACTYAKSKAKSCINVERLSELGVTLDMTHNMAYSTSGNDIKYGIIDSDGFITKYELDDMENRAMFATLNHMGFIPQEYQDSIDGYTTQVPDEHTGYLIPKFKYIYPVDFDGRMQPIMTRYKHGFEQATFDELDESYVTFRLGAESNTRKDRNEDGRIRHFYSASTHGYQMPLYNNSFYFYFGVNKGSTAIDRFNKMFYAPCFQNNKNPFTLDYNSKGRSYCPSTYENGQIPNYYGYAYIDVLLEDIKTPYSYVLYDSSNNVVISETGMDMSRFVIGGKIDTSGTIVSNDNGSVQYQIGENKGTPVPGRYGTDGLSNQIYRLVITDVSKKSIVERIEISVPKISVDYEAEELGTKFYSTASTRIDYICTDENNFFGKIKITDFVVDGYRFNITNSIPIGYDRTTDSYNIRVSGSALVGDNIELGTEAIIRLSVVENSGTGFVRECLCDSSNETARIQSAAGNMHIASAEETQYWFDSGEVIFYVYQPNRFMLTITQICDGIEVDENTSSEIVTVYNGENFNTYLSGMPVKFMLGSVNDSSAATIANQSNFYRSNVTTTPNGAGLTGWYGLHQEDTYKFNRNELQTLEKNEEVWEDFVSLNSSIKTYTSKANILVFKFNSMFSLSTSAYVTDASTPFTYEARGGVDPILYRSVVPQYESYENFGKKYVLSDDHTATVIPEFPNIVGNNYMGHTSDEQGVYFNNIAYTENTNKVGNYFAAFTRNGGYTSSTNVDSTIKVMKIPNFTKVTPRNGNEKVIGNDEVASLNSFPYAYTKTGNTKTGNFQPYLRGMFVDRRFDFDLTIVAPLFGDAINLYPLNGDEQDGREKIWQSARISGWTFNGVEMSYDGEYNIVSANTNESDDSVITKAEPNKTLEYSYSIPEDGTDGDAVTVYNNQSNMVWEEDASSTNQIIKRFYEASFGGFDIRNYFWSYFNEQTLSTNAGGSIVDKMPYIFTHPRTDMRYNTLKSPYGYNGDFNMKSVCEQNNYPTVRAIDICNIPSRGSYEFNVISCSYNMQATRLQNGRIECITLPDDGIRFNGDFFTPIIFLPPNDDSNDYCNALYGSVSDVSGYRMFKSSNINLYFKYNSISNQDFDVYTSIPRVVRVLPYIDGYDGISYIKTVTPNGEIAAVGTIDSAIEDVLIHRFEKMTHGLWDVFTKVTEDIYAPSNIALNRDMIFKNSTNEKIGSYFFYNKDTKEYLTSDANEFENIKFQRENIDLKGATVFSIVVDRRYVYVDDDMLKRRLRTIEFSDIYDCRKVLIRVATGVENSYVLCVAGSTTIKDVPTPTGGSASINQDPETGEVDPEASVTIETEPRDYNGDVKNYIQVITFQMLFHKNANPEDAESQAFANYKMMGYTFRFRNNRGDEFDIQPTNIVGTDNGNTLTLSFTVRWNSSMGILADIQWQGNTKCTLFAKTQSGFIYKLNNFSILYSAQSGNYDPATKQSDMEDGQTYETSFNRTGIR